VVLASACGAGAGLVLPFGCQDPTQVSVALRTAPGVCEAVGPAASKRTEVFVGSPRTPLGEPRAQVAGCAGEDLGSFTLVPSGKDGDVLVEVVMALSPGKSSDACRADPTACIVARRRVAFAKRRSLRMSIRLDPQCIGVSCDPDSTCFAGGCRPADTVCSGADCDLREGDGGSPFDASGPADASGAADASSDATGSDASDAAIACPLPSVTPTLIAGTGDLLFFTDGTATKLVRLEVSTGTELLIGNLSSAAVILAANGGRAVAASETEIFHGPPFSKAGAPVGRPLSLAVIDDPILTYAYATAAATYFSSSAQPYNAPLVPLVAGKEFYGVTAAQIFRGLSPTALDPHAAASAPYLLAVGPDNRAYWTSAASDLFLAGFPGDTAIASIPALEAMTTRGNLWFGAVTASPPVGWGYDLVAARMGAGGALSPPTKFGELRGVGAQSPTVQLAVAGPCVYALSGARIAGARYP
jgi:hypothetical protein